MKSNPQPRTIPKAVVADPAAPSAGQTPATPATGTAASNLPTARTPASQAKLTIRMDATDLGRARSAWRIACAQPGSTYPTFGQWAATALMAATEAIEADHNGGRPLDPTPAGVIPTGNATR